MTTPKLSDSTLHRNASAKSIERGRDYYESGAVVGMTLRGNTLQAEVEGSESEPYFVRLNFTDSGLSSADCTCPYSFEGWCKHIVATLLACSHQAEQVVVRPSLAQLLDQLDHPQTRRLVQELATEQPALLERIDYHVNIIAGTDAIPEPPAVQQTQPKHRSTVDPAPFRRAVRQLLRNTVDGFESGWDDYSINEDLEALIAQAQAFLATGDDSNALVVLTAISDACADYWEDVEEYGVDSDEAAMLLNHAWTEVILSTELTPAEKTELRTSLQLWQDQLGGSFAMSLDALQQGWDYPSLQQVLQGQVTPTGAWDGEQPTYANELAAIRLEILDRQGRYQEYLHLADAEGQTESYLTKLARLGQTEKVMEASKTRMSTQTEAFAVAQALCEQGAQVQALEIAQAGLNLAGHDYLQHQLAIWTSEQAEGLGDRSAALSARIIAFKTEPSFADYQKIQELADQEWTAVRADLLDHLQQHRAWGSEQARVDIFLHEKLIDKAIKSVDKLSYYHSGLVHRVMDVAISQRPDWVITNARSRAEEIMDEGRANAYHHAIEWLSKVRAAYLASQRQSEWSAYRADLMQTHGRKRKLMAMLKDRDLA